jgi:uncharacterized protein YjiS (DUF1127 family)
MFVSWVLSKLQKAVSDRRTMSMLRELDSRTLDDIGLSRWNIATAVRDGVTR